MPRAREDPPACQPREGPAVLSCRSLGSFSPACTQGPAKEIFKRFRISCPRPSLDTGPFLRHLRGFYSEAGAKNPLVYSSQQLSTVDVLPICILEMMKPRLRTA